MGHGLVRLVVAALVFAVSAGCGGDDDGGGGPSCESVGQRVCDLACDCTEGDGCSIQLAASVLTHNTPDECSGFWVNLACMQEENDIDYAECDAALAAADCVDTGAGMALVFPAECGESGQ